MENTDIQNTTEAKQDRQRFRTANAIVIIGWVLITLVSLGIIGSSLYLMISGVAVPEPLGNWGSTVLGFLFGMLMGLVREFIDIGDKDKK
jgi:hypothetical protein